MDKIILKILQLDVEFQCKCALKAANLLDSALALRNSDDIWFSLQSLLVAAANLSKLFWGSRGKKELERLDLRKSLAVADDSPLRDPDLRNDFEHFDTRVEDWLEKWKDHNFMSRNIGPHSAVTGIPVEERFQWYDPSIGIVTFWRHSVSLPAVMTEVRRIMPVVEAAIQGPWNVAPMGPISQMTCGTCGILTPQCTCLDAEGNPLRWG